ncbi:hypothetical protein AWB75_03386 [Caballeronia catudaia]|uniref:Uncharacterized protein n=1 Tax=Caballeronia catudaia TaxID=1777136 RepID=A0A158BES0_9BURK|nr:hypothetical protein AWB75_03386 [Caballeronia catudaia]
MKNDKTPGVEQNADQHPDPVLHYHEVEMRYLREAGREFTRAHPDRARMLNLDRVGDRDPYVERRLYLGLPTAFAMHLALTRQIHTIESPRSKTWRAPL